MCLGVIKGTKIEINIGFLLLLLVFCWLGRLGEVAVLAVCVLLHEMAHGILAVWCGLAIARLELLPCGGVIELSGLRNAGGWRTMAIAAAGPLMSLLLAAGAWLCGFYQLYEINLMLGAFNLLPLLPLDGSHIIRPVLERWLSPEAVTGRLALITFTGCGMMTVKCGYDWLVQQKLQLSIILIIAVMTGEAVRQLRGRKLSAAERYYRKAFQLAEHSCFCTGAYIVRQDKIILEQLNKLPKSGHAVFMVIDDCCHIKAILTEYELWKAVCNGGTQLRFGDVADK